jgi:hypothetical protein
MLIVYTSTNKYEPACQIKCNIHIMLGLDLSTFVLAIQPKWQIWLAQHLFKA